MQLLAKVTEKNSHGGVKTKSNQGLVNPMLPLRKQNTRFGDIYPSLYNSRRSIRSGLKFCIPIKEIHPAFMKMIGGEFAAHIAQLFCLGLAWRFAKLETCLVQRL